MQNDYLSDNFKKLLDKLQQESWQLELIISGFAIYGLFAAIEPVDLKIERAAANDNMQIAFGWVIVSMAQYILIFNLVLHVLLRGLWIGAIGLRYVSGDIEYDELKYSKKFTEFLKNKVGSFDRYIARLENYCSLMFAITFLLIFYVIGAFLVIALFVLFLSSFPEIFKNASKPLLILVAVITFLISICFFIVFIDFMGQGFLKRKNWTSKIYFPIYRIFGFLTLSFLYRPLIYNFLDNKLGKKISLFLVPAYIGIIMINGTEYQNSNYLGIENNSSEFQLSKNHYEDMIVNPNEFINVASIPTKVIEKPYLKVFLLYSKQLEDFVFESNETLKPEEDLRGFKTPLNDFKRGMDQAAGKSDSVNLKSYLKTTNELYNIKIDSFSYKSNFVISKNVNDRIGFETYLDIEKLQKGQHLLIISGPKKETEIDKNSKTIKTNLVTIPFWYYPQNSPAIQNVQLNDTTTNK